MTASDGSKTECPCCGKQMTVHYTSWDSATDPDSWIHVPGFGNRSLKYVSPKRLAIAVAIVVAIFLVGFWLKW